MFSKSTAFVAAALISTVTFVSAANAGVEYRGGPKSAASASVEKNKVDSGQQNGDRF